MDNEYHMHVVLETDVPQSGDQGVLNLELLEALALL